MTGPLRETRSSEEGTRPQRAPGSVEALHDLSGQIAHLGARRDRQIVQILRHRAEQAVDLCGGNTEVADGVRVVKHAPLDAVQLPWCDLGDLQPRREAGQELDALSG